MLCGRRLQPAACVPLPLPFFLISSVAEVPLIYLLPLKIVPKDFSEVTVERPKQEWRSSKCQPAPVVFDLSAPGSRHVLKKMRKGFEEEPESQRVPPPPMPAQYWQPGISS